MFSWLVAPFLITGLEPLWAGRIVIALSGAGMVVGCWHLSRRFDLPANFRFMALIILTLLIADWTIQFITADVLIAAFLVFYLYLVTSGDLLSCQRKACATGIVAGIAYYAKNYMLPFFMIHFPLMLLLQYIFFRNEGRILSWRRLVVSYISGVLCFFVIASGWILALSSRYGEFTLTGKSRIAFALMGPEEVRHPPLFYDGLHRHSNDYQIHVFEDHTVLKYKTWSPFENRKYFIHQLKLIKTNLIYLFNHFVNLSPFFTYAFVICIFLIAVLSLLVNRMSRENGYLYAWIVITFVVYSSGYVLLIARSPRRFYALMAVFVFASCHFAEGLINRLSDGLNKKRRNLLVVFIALIIVGAFSVKPGIHLFRSASNIILREQVNAYRDIAEQIAVVDFPSPYAIVRSSQKPYTDYYIAFYLRKQFLGRPLSSDIDGITAELKSVGARSLIVFDNLEIVSKLEEDERYEHAGRIVLKEDERYWNAVNIKQDEVKRWDREVNVFIVKNNDS
jgi:hypothetical protein